MSGKIVSNPEGKDKISSDLIDRLNRSVKGIAIVDLSGTGEASSASADLSFSSGKLRVISRSELWFGKTMLGEWVKELNVVTKFQKPGQENTTTIEVD